MGDINLKNNGSVLLYSKISVLDSQFMFGGSSISDTQRQHKTFMSSLLTSRQNLMFKIFSK